MGRNFLGGGGLLRGGFFGKVFFTGSSNFTEWIFYWVADFYGLYYGEEFYGDDFYVSGKDFFMGVRFYG